MIKMKIRIIKNENKSINGKHNIQKVTSELLDELLGRWEVLKEFRGHVIDDALIEHLLRHH